MSKRSNGTDTPDKLAALDKLLEAAEHFVNEVAGDRTFTRLVEVFRRMPREDREVLVPVLEHEVEHRVVNAKMASMTGYTLAPNPHARLYFRVFSTSPPPAAGRDRDDMMVASLRALKTMAQVLSPTVHDEWLAAAREAAEQLEPHERIAAQRVLSEMLAILSTSGESVAAERKTANKKK